MDCTSFAFFCRAGDLKMSDTIKTNMDKLIEQTLGKSKDVSMRRSSDFLRTETILLQESIRLIMRDAKKYAGITAALYLSDFLGITKGIRSAYFACRAIDDMGDGDRDIVGGTAAFPSLLASLHHQLERGGRDPNIPCSYLLADAVQHAGGKENHGEVIQEFHTFLDTTLIDFNRRLNRTVFMSKELDAHYLKSFRPVHNLALIALQSRSRADDVGLLPLLQGKVYALRDMARELPRGEINIPREVVQQTGFVIEDLMKHPDILNVPAVREWAEIERSMSIKLLNDIESQPKKDKGIQRMLSVLLPSIRQFLFANQWRESVTKPSEHGR